MGIPSYLSASRGQRTTHLALTSKLLQKGTLNTPPPGRKGNPPAPQAEALSYSSSVSFRNAFSSNNRMTGQQSLKQRGSKLPSRAQALLHPTIYSKWPVASHFHDGKSASRHNFLQEEEGWTRAFSSGCSVLIPEEKYSPAHFLLRLTQN